MPERYAKGAISGERITATTKYVQPRQSHFTYLCWAFAIKYEPFAAAYFRLFTSLW